MKKFVIAAFTAFALVSTTAFGAPTSGLDAFIASWVARRPSDGNARRERDLSGVEGLRHRGKGGNHDQGHRQARAGAGAPGRERVGQSTIQLREPRRLYCFRLQRDGRGQDRNPGPVHRANRELERKTAPPWAPPTTARQVVGVFGALRVTRVGCK